MEYTTAFCGARRRLMGNESDNQPTHDDEPHSLGQLEYRVPLSLKVWRAETKHAHDVLRGGIRPPPPPSWVRT